jgi:hypothetical protein
MTTAGPALVAGRYRLGEMLGEGGMGKVWLARDTTLDRDVAIKEIVLPAELAGADRDEVQDRTLREARAAARLNHANVARVYDAFQMDGRTWIVMEHVPSRSLQEAIDADGPMAPDRVARIGLEVLAALAAAHGAGVTHRDVKPANVLLGDDGRVVLTDFGVATIEGDGITTTRTDQVVGSPQYMAPERATSGAKLPASDLWSLGATLYAAVEGRPPYQRPSAVGTLTALVADEPDPMVLAGSLQPVLEGLLRKDPAERIDADETRRLLKKAGRGRVAGIATTAVDIQLPARRRPLLLVVAVVVLLVAGLATWLVLRPDGGGAKPVAAGEPSAPATAPKPTAGATPTAAPSTRVSSSASAGSGGGTTLPALPSGWRDYHDKTGFKVYVPEGWTRSQDGTIVYFRDSATGRVLGIDQTHKPQWNPVADWQGKARYRVAHGDFPGYHKVKIAEVKYFRKAADWEYTFDGKVRQHVNNRGVVVSASQAYGIYWQTSDRDWTAARKDLQLIFDSFRPAA